MLMKYVSDEAMNAHFDPNLEFLGTEQEFQGLIGYSYILIDQYWFGQLGDSTDKGIRAWGIFEFDVSNVDIDTQEQEHILVKIKDAPRILYVADSFDAVKTYLKGQIDGWVSRWG